MAKRKNDIETVLSQLDQLADAPPDDETWFGLRRGLLSKHGVVIGKAAKIAAQLEWKDGIPDMLKAYERLSNNGANVDPGCIGKANIIKALRRLKAYEPTTYIRGIRYKQFEAVWGGKEDRAAQLRAECALALAETGYSDALLYIADLLADPETEARAGAAQALSCFSGTTPIALLRLRALSGEQNVRVLEEIFSVLFALSGPTTNPEEKDETVRFVAQFLESSDVDVVSVAAITLGSSRRLSAFNALREFAENILDEERLRISFEAIAILRLPEAFDYVVDTISRGSELEARLAEQAMSIYRDDERLWERVETARADRKGEDGLSFLFDD
ncbi:hypothetical protein C1752_14379 [Acaryochloris thomasi RCC1774]|uniref:HEAT repeat domain-containing protein n=1 Tax=Acaryochloris thomasi RCC1774 TaxID=1764569 RepID=A0A2W1JGH3_9CYAN|nr:hypothetical protein [Acaryochloris thomasi]PZD70292.1 hypothetical protein C1752_14379 [Acaryochloris thomasi RCC1774]